jgi:hydroxymethylcytosylglucuronate/cytosylglucuronate synthase
MKPLHVLAAAIPFGLGPAGKLATLVEDAPWISWYACGDEFDLSIFEPGAFRGHLWSRDRDALRDFARSRHIDRAIVVLDPPLALLLEEIGIAVLYVDSLPFLWTDADLVPTRVTAYCAQLCLDLPKPAWRQLGSVRNLIWTQGIVPRDRPRWQNSKRVGQFLVNFGGLSSPHSEGLSYAEAVLPPLLQAIDRSDCQKLMVTSSKAGVQVLRSVGQTAKGASTRIQLEFCTLPKKVFLREIGRSEIFLTSPGLTTLLETAGIQTPTILLPPQNLSQYSNERMHRMAFPEHESILWPTKNLDFVSLEPHLQKGEELVVKRIDHSLAQLRGDAEIREKLEIAFRMALARVRKCGVRTKSILDVIGGDGSAQILEVLGGLLERT